MTRPRLVDLAELVRLPAVLTVPGDVLLGAAASGQARHVRRTAGLAAASSCVYLGGMALNDYADRDVDARERPSRPIPSGRVSPGFALGVAVCLTVSGASLAVAADGARALKIFAPLTSAVWAYDLVSKSTASGALWMSACRGLDVAFGAGPHGVRRALPDAIVVAAHTAVVTEVSRREVAGATPALARWALAATATVAAAGAAVHLRGMTGWARRSTLGLAGAYCTAFGCQLVKALRDPAPERLQRAVGDGILALILLEAGLLAGVGAIGPAAGVAALWPVARSLTRRRAVT